MIFVPLPFIVALILAMLAIRLVRAEEGGRHHRLFLTLLVAYALQSVLVGLRWGYDLRATMPAQALLAAFIAPLAYAAFRSLAEDEAERPAVFWAHLLLPPLATGALVIWLPELVGPLITSLFVGYGGALFWLARRGPDALVGSRLDGALRSYRALILTGAALIASALMDVFISADLEWTGGRHTPVLIASFNVVALLLLGTAAAAADSSSRSAPDEVDEAPPAAMLAPPETDGQDAAIIASLDALMRERRLFTDADLDLRRLARRLALPSRRLSQAINRTHGISVSHYVNGLRISEAQRLLRETDYPVTRVMLESGFLTKSNFNREFQRVAGTSPTAWRQQQASS